MKEITILVPFENALKGSDGQVARVVGNSLAYIRVPATGESLAITGEAIEGYKGQSFSELGLREGAHVVLKMSQPVERKISAVPG